MGLVFDRYPAGGGEMLLALKLADHAHEDGSHVFPSVATLAEKTRQSERTVQYQLRKMQASGWLVLVRASRGGRGQTSEYRISEAWINGANFAPLEPEKRCNPERETVQSDALNGATAIAPEPSLTVKETPCPNLHSDVGSQGSKPEGKVADPEDTRLAEWMFGLVLQLQPKHKPPNWAKWANEIRLMQQRDSRSRREIAALFRWANEHSFWRSNILSPAKLREKWDQLEIRRKTESALPGAVAAKAPPVIDRQCAFFERGIRCTCAGVTSTGNHPSSPWFCAPHLERVEQGDMGDPVPGKRGVFEEVRA